MALFSLGSGVVVDRKVPYGVAQAFRLAEDLIHDYRNQGLTVEVRSATPGESLLAAISNKEGTKLQVQIDLRALDSGCEITVTVKGKVHVGGMQGMFASDSKVRKIAKERMVALLKKIYNPAKTPVEAIPEPEVQPEPIAPVEDISEQNETDASEEALTNDGVPSESADPASGEPEPHESVADTEASPSEDPAPTVDDSPAPQEQVPATVESEQTISASSETKAEEAKPSVVVNAAGRSLEERLTILKLMLDRGLITTDDFKWKKNELLASI